MNGRFIIVLKTARQWTLFLLMQDPFYYDSPTHSYVSPFGLPPRSMHLSSDPTFHTRSSHLILTSGGQYSIGSF